MNRYDLLRRFHDISPKDYELLTAALQARSFKKGEYIVVPGQTQKELYFVNSGVQMSFFESEKTSESMISSKAYPVFRRWISGFGKLVLICS